MKKAAVIISLLLSVVMLIMIIGLKEEVDMLSYQIQNAQNNITNRINELESFINLQHEEQASILSSYDWEYTNENKEERTVTIHVTAMLKEYSEGTTEAFLVCKNGTELPMTLENGVFVCDIVAGISDDVVISHFMFKDDDNVRTVPADMDLSLKFAEFLPRAFVDFDGSCSFSHKTQSIKFGVEGNVFLQVENGTWSSAEKAELVIKINSKEMKRILMSSDSEIGGKENVFYNVDLNEEYPVEIGDKAEIYVELTDSLGFKHVINVSGTELIEDGHTAESVEYGSRSVYDENGKLIFEESGF